MLCCDFLKMLTKEKSWYFAFYIELGQQLQLLFQYLMRNPQWISLGTTASACMTRTGNRVDLSEGEEEEKEQFQQRKSIRIKIPREGKVLRPTMQQ